MHRKDFIKYTSLASVGLLAGSTGYASEKSKSIPTSVKPLAITMWDFSWLERRWPGAGYEDWDRILDELKERGYNAVRIDAYPHLVAAGAKKEWALLPQWDQNDWGSPGLVKIAVLPGLTDFIAKCKKRAIKVGLSTWYREDVNNVRMQISSPQKMAANWITVLDVIAAENLMDTVLYVDLCNEWMASPWVPYLKNIKGMVLNHDWTAETSLQWMKAAIEIVSDKYPQLPYTFSMDTLNNSWIEKTHVPFLDFIEAHIWMSSANGGEFNSKIGIDWNGFSSADYKRLVEKGETLYREKPDYWKNMLTSNIQRIAGEANKVNQPLMTTECWSVVNYKDYPGLNWDWVKDLCAIGVSAASTTGQWVAIATSNFCGPQFRGMWRDVAWHKKQTDIIKKGQISDSLKTTKLFKRLWV